MADQKKVTVRLAARCLVDNVVREKGEYVQIDAEIAESFGEVQKPAAAAKAEKE